MPLKRLKEFLDSHDVKYVTMSHSPAYTAQEIAAAAHVSGWEMAKTVIVKIDGEFAMAVLPASEHIDFEALKEALDGSKVELATEAEFKDLFPKCDVGAMPPFGNLYGLPVYVAPELAEDEQIVFSAGSHTELVRMNYQDFEDLVQPSMLSFAVVN